jgi:malonate-semialdehyde dehydrogenase (acetylating)/methylmalonate-semialdehyde dehydrogenase
MKMNVGPVVVSKSKKLELFIDGRRVCSRTSESRPVVDPATQKVLGHVPFATRAEIDRAVNGARLAQTGWAGVSPLERMRLMMRYASLLKENRVRIAKVLSRDNGKTLEDAKGSVWRGIEVVEHACSIPSLLQGEIVENLAAAVDSYQVAQPLGVCAGITPFNFPAMVPLWMFPMAIACGNSFVLKPSEQVPYTPMLLAELLTEAGAPKGLLQIVHGGKEQVDWLLTHPDVKAVSFVGSAAVARHIYELGCKHLKRVQALAGAKNHMVVMPDANMDQAAKALVGSSCGAAGQRCMAISVAVLVGAAKKIVPQLVKGMKSLRLGPCTDAKADLGPLVSRAARERVAGLIRQGKKEGAQCLLDGSNAKVKGSPRGNWIGPTLFAKVKPGMSIYDEEIFGPVLSCVEAGSLDEAIRLVSDNPYGNGTSIFTSSGAVARRFVNAVDNGQVGVNVPIPVPPPYYAFSGWKNSFYGDMGANGKEGMRFYTRNKKVLSRWFDDRMTAKINTTISLK